MDEKKIILAIDDNAQQHREFKAMLVPQYDLRVVMSATDAVTFLNTSKADLILLDIEMPNVSGFDFLGDIRSIPTYMKVPIIIVSGNNSAEFLAKAKSSTANGVLVKPVVPQVLLDTIEKLFAAEDAAKADANRHIGEGFSDL